MAIKDGVQLRIVFPAHLHATLQSEAEDTAVPIASLIRMAVYERCERRRARYHRPLVAHGNGRLVDLVLRYKAGQVTAQEVAEQLVVIVPEMPVAYQLTPAGKAMTIDTS